MNSHADMHLQPEPTGAVLLSRHDVLQVLRLMFGAPGAGGGHLHDPPTLAHLDNHHNHHILYDLFIDVGYVV